MHSHEQAVSHTRYNYDTTILGCFHPDCLKINPIVLGSLVPDNDHIILDVHRRIGRYDPAGRFVSGGDPVLLSNILTTLYSSQCEHADNSIDPAVTKDDCTGTRAERL